MSQAIFIHGLDSSSRGAKASWFKEHFPQMIIPDFTGTLAERLESLHAILNGYDNLTLIGSSFGGLMATIFALENEARVRQVLLLAPALNFPDFGKYRQHRITVPARLYIGSNDTVCPPALVIPAARQIFGDLIVAETADDHLLRKTFSDINWRELLGDCGCTL